MSSRLGSDFIPMASWSNLNRWIEREVSNKEEDDLFIITCPSHARQHLTRVTVTGAINCAE